MRRMIVAVVLVLITSMFVLSSPTPSSASSKVKVTVKLSDSSPGTSSTIHVKVCWSNAAGGDVVNLSEESTASLSWSVVSKHTIAAATGCKSWSRSSGTIGEYPYRAELRQGHSVLGTSKIETDRTFGTISAMTFFTSEFGCQGGGTVTVAAHSYRYFCALNVGLQATSDYNMFLHPTTCRSLTLRMTGTDNPKGSPTDQSNLVVEIQQSGQVLPAIFSANNIENFTYKLNGSAGALNIWATAGFATGEAVYFLSGSTANCSTATGV